MGNDPGLYNSKIIKTYREYLRRFYPDISMAEIFEYAGMAMHEIEDGSHWFTQDQVDKFYKILVEKTGQPNIAREVGRYTASSESLGAAKKYTLGLIGITSAYLLMEKLYPIMSRGAEVKAMKINDQTIRIVSTPRPGVHEKPHQCENRLGTFEALGKWFTGRYAKVEHPSCYHKGGKSCIYEISWEKTNSLTWKQIGNYVLILTFIASALLFFWLPLMPWVLSVISCMLIAAFTSLYAYQLQTKELTKTIETQGNVAKELLEETSLRYNDAILVQEIGQIISTLLDVDNLVSTVAGVLERRLDFDRGMIMLASSDKSRLVYSSGYGYSKDNEEILKKTEFHLDKTDSKGIFVLAFKKRKPFLINGISELETEFSPKSRELIQKVEVESLVCVPIVYKDESLGILVVDNVKSKRPLIQSDVNLLMGVASQIATGIINAISFERIQESEQKYRELVENASSIILRMKTNGEITFFNEFAQKLFGYSDKEIIGRNIKETVFSDRNGTSRDLDSLVEIMKMDPDRRTANEERHMLRDGRNIWIAWTYKPICKNGNVEEILCIGNDVTELKKADEERKSLETQLYRAQRMEAIGTLAGGIAHDFNNILQALFGYTQMILMGKEETDPDYDHLKAIERSLHRAGELTKRLLVFSRKVQSELKPVNLNQEVVEVSKMLERTIPKMIQIELRLAADLKNINADTGQLEQIIMNLAVNARDAMPDGGIMTFRTRNVMLDSKFCESHLGANPGEFVLLSVTDTGHGMDKETADRVFEPFFTTKETGKGTGLGLSMVYGIVKNHGGYINCVSRMGAGTTFEVYFPASWDQPEEEKARTKRVPLEGGYETILLVDDEKDIREIAKEMLERLGYGIITADNGESAIAVYRERHRDIDLVILDLIMPGMGGKKCLEELLRINTKAKVIVASGQSIDGFAKETIDRHAKGFVGKPYKLEQMLRMIQKVLRAS